MLRRSLVLTCLTLLCLALSAPVGAEEGADGAKARARGVEAREALPPLSPGISVEFHGDLVIEELWAGEVRIGAKLAKAGRDYVWRITEDSFLDWTGGEVREKLMVHAGQDLAVLSGTYDRTDRDGTSNVAFSRGEAGLELQRTRKTGDTWSDPESLALATAPKALAGLGSVLMFLRALGPKATGTYAVPYVSAAAFKEPAAATARQATLTCEGKSTWTFGGQKFDTSLVRFDPGGQVWNLHLDRDHRRLIAMVSATGPVQIVPGGLGGERVAVDPREPATTWKQAFLKFGFGYHMAREELLSDAFHWPLMYEFEVKELKRWPAEKPVEEFKDAWIAEFVAGSLHRDVPATRRLLSMTLATGKIKKETDTEVIFWAHPNFGGGTQRTYYLKKVDDRWGLWRIEF
ncbi:MAG: hypothetical protein O2894_01340 [Planctomycetota bacterium]|nr:hypothetical protein [Planctomycetota bacterium]